MEQKLAKMFVNHVVQKVLWSTRRGVFLVKHVGIASVARRTYIQLGVYEWQTKMISGMIMLEALQ